MLVIAIRDEALPCAAEGPEKEILRKKSSVSDRNGKVSNHKESREINTIKCERERDGKCLPGKAYIARKWPPRIE